MMRLFDEKFKEHKTEYFLQCSLAMVSMAIALVILDAVSNAAILGALGASSFIIFTMPHRRVSNARFLIGGYIVGIAVGTLCYWSNQLLAMSQIEFISESEYTVFFAGIAVGLAIFLMVITDTEHPPAAGVAMGLVLGEWNLQAIGVVLIGIAYMAGMRKLLKSYMIDLL
ncbi:MAG: HPP family protein [Phycisphaerae bacterium]|nr:HPP family protein [Phycisphaerae bacterium]